MKYWNRRGGNLVIKTKVGLLTYKSVPGLAGWLPDWTKVPRYG